MVVIKTYIKKNVKITSLDNLEQRYQDYFVPCDGEECLCHISDFDYLEGVITIDCDEVVMLGFEQWDLVDQTWSYLIGAIDELMNGKGEVQFFLPDQPLKIKLQSISASCLLLRVDEKTCVVDKYDFLLSALHEAKSFFAIMNKCNNEGLVEHSKKELEKLEIMLKKLDSKIKMEENYDSRE